MSPQKPQKRATSQTRKNLCRLSCILFSFGVVSVILLCCLLYTDFIIDGTKVKKIHLLISRKLSEAREATGEHMGSKGKMHNPMSETELDQDFEPSAKVSPFQYGNHAPKLASVKPVDPGLAKAINNAVQPPLEETFDCDRLFKGDIKETKRAMSYQQRVNYDPPSSSEIIQATISCDYFKQARGYRLVSSKHESDFPLAFSILVHKSVEQFERLLRTIYRPTNHYCIHIDRKSSPLIHTAMKAIVKCFDNVFIASKLEEVVYGGYTRLQADINCMKELYDLRTDWKYLLNLAGSEFPLLPNNQIVYILKRFNGTNIIERHVETDNPWRYQRKFKTLPTNGSRPGRLIKESETNSPAPHNLVATKCSAYGIFSRRFIRYALYNPVAQALLKWTETTYSPDEIFWGTLNNLQANPQLGTPGGDHSNIDNRLARAVLWKSPSCHGRNVHIICNFGAGDLPWLKGSYQMFANKFDLEVDQVALTCMEELLTAREIEERPKKLKPFLKYLRHANGNNTLK